MKSWKAMIAALGVGAMVLGIAGAAAADPTNAKKGEIRTIECDQGLGTLTIALNGNAKLTPGLVTTSTQVAVPYRSHIEASFTPTGGEIEFFVDDIEKPAPSNGRLAVCTFHDEGPAPGGTFVLDGTVWISYTPSP